MSKKTPIRVETIMRRSFVTVDGLETVADTLMKMKQSSVPVAIVRKRHDDDEIGMVLLADIARQVLARDRSAVRINVYEIMTKPVISVSPDMDIRYCARLFEQYGLTSAPVVKNADVVGVVSYNELVLEGIWPAVSG